MSNPIIVKITKEQRITEHETRNGMRSTLWQIEGEAEDGKCYSWVRSTFTHKDGNITINPPHNFKEIV